MPSLNWRSVYEEPWTQGELEDLLVDRIVSSVWWLRCLNRVGAGILAWYRGGVLVERARREVKSHERSACAALAESMDRATITDEQAHRAAVAVLRASSRPAGTGDRHPGLAYIKDAEGPDALSKLSRYETMIEQGLYRALHELQRLQAARTGQAVAPPVAVDVSISPAE